MNAEIKQKLTRNSLHIIGMLSPKLAGQIAGHIFTTPSRVPAPSREEIYLEGARKITLKSGYRGFVWGKDGTLGSILLVHGWSGRAGQMGMFGQILSKHGYTVYAFDGPGHGISPGHTTDPRRFANFIINTANEVGDIVGVIAHSFGAGASAFAVSMGLNIDKLVYMAGPYYYKTILDEFATFMQLDARVNAAFYAKMENLVGIPMDQMVVGKFLQGSHVQGLIIHDEQDDIVPITAAKLLHQDWVNSEIYITNGLGHRKILHDNTVAAKVLEFF